MSPEPIVNIISALGRIEREYSISYVCWCQALIQTLSYGITTLTPFSSFLLSFAVARLAGAEIAKAVTSTCIE